MTLISQIQRWWQDRSDESFYHQLSDEQLLVHYQTQCTQAALSILIQRHSDALYHFLLTLSDAHLAEDICQATWLKLVERPDRFQNNQAQFRTWLFTTGRHALIDELRRLNRWQWASLDELTEQDNEDWNEHLTFARHPDIQAKFDDALVQMPFAQREALMLQLDGFSLADIAVITQEKQETIKSRLRFARHFLKKTLEVTYESE